MITAYLGIGSNLGDRFLKIKQAVNRIKILPDTNIVALSSIYETEPIGYLNQPTFLNLVAAIGQSYPRKNCLLMSRKSKEIWGEKGGYAGDQGQ